MLRHLPHLHLSLPLHLLLQLSLPQLPLLLRLLRHPRLNPLLSLPLLLLLPPLLWPKPLLPLPLPSR